MADIARGCSECGALSINGNVDHKEPCRRTVPDAIHHPKHYTSHPAGIECIDVVEHLAFNVGNAIKYLWRAGLKTESPIEDLEKARWYVEREIERRRKVL